MAKGRHWLDTNVFIDAKTGLYGFDLVPRFWKWLEDQMKGGKICSSQMIYDEICSLESLQDELYKWTKQRRESGYWITPDKDVQAEYTKIARMFKRHMAQLIQQGQVISWRKPMYG